MKSDKTVLNILEDFLDEHAGESAWEDAVKALNAHYLTIAERLIGEDLDENQFKKGSDYWLIRENYQLIINEFKLELRTAFRKEYGGENE